MSDPHFGLVTFNLTLLADKDLCLEVLIVHGNELLLFAGKKNSSLTLITTKVFREVGRIISLFHM